jgi:hypothetical protein
MATGRQVFEIKTGVITIDYTRCQPATQNTSTPPCGFACVKACRLYGRNILKIENNRPVLAVSTADEVKRLDNECLACEYACWSQGSGCIDVHLPLAGLEEYERRTLSKPS